MDRISVRFGSTWRGEYGASMVEYALLVALIAIVAIVALTLAGGSVSEQFSNIASNVDGANG